MRIENPSKKILRFLFTMGKDGKDDVDGGGWARRESRGDVRRDRARGDTIENGDGPEGN